MHLIFVILWIITCMNEQLGPKSFSRSFTVSESERMPLWRSVNLCIVLIFRVSSSFNAAILASSSLPRKSLSFWKSSRIFFSVSFLWVCYRKKTTCHLLKLLTCLRFNKPKFNRYLNMFSWWVAHLLESFKSYLLSHDILGKSLK